MTEDRYTLRGVMPLHMIHKWSIEHPYAVIAFWFSVVVLAIIVVMKRAYNDVLTLMNVIQANLPPTGANLKPSWVVPIDPLNLPILTFGLTG
ncbi:MAG: hypothetical protein ACO2PL_05590, partial [Armatimonadota bacterium]